MTICLKSRGLLPLLTTGKCLMTQFYQIFNTWQLQIFHLHGLPTNLTLVSKEIWLMFLHLNPLWKNVTSSDLLLNSSTFESVVEDNVTSSDLLLNSSTFESVVEDNVTSSDLLLNSSTFESVVEDNVTSSDLLLNSSTFESVVEDNVTSKQ